MRVWVLYASIGAMVVFPTAARSVEAAPIVSPHPITWTVIDRFRFITPCPVEATPAAQSGCRISNDELAALLDPATWAGDYAELTPAQFNAKQRRIVAALAYGRELAKPDGSALKQLGSLPDIGIWNTAFNPAARRLRNGRVAPASEAFDRNYLFPANYRLKLNAPEGFSGTCEWLINDSPPQAGPCTGFTISLKAKTRTEASEAEGAWHSESARVRVRSVASGAATRETEVRVRDVLIASLGDSFASGEGNPDRQSFIPPSAWGGAVDRSATTTSSPAPKYNRGWLNDAQNAPGYTPADWMDAPCHRSLVSNHAMAAFKYAAEHPDRAVTFVPLACSGAEIFDGVVLPRSSFPGLKRSLLLSWLPDIADSESQIDTLERLRCARSSDIRPRPDVLSIIRASFPEHSTRSPNLRPDADLAAPVRCDGPARPVDIMLLSVGGNDIGFGGAVSWAILPENGLGFLAGLVINAANRRSIVCPDDASVIPTLTKSIEDKDTGEGGQGRCESRKGKSGEVGDSLRTQPTQWPADIVSSPYYFPTERRIRVISDRSESAGARKSDNYIRCDLPTAEIRIQCTLISAYNFLGAYISNGLDQSKNANSSANGALSAAERVMLVSYPDISFFRGRGRIDLGSGNAKYYNRSLSCPTTSWDQYAELYRNRARTDLTDKQVGIHMTGRRFFEPGFQALESLGLQFYSTRGFRLNLLASESNKISNTVSRPIQRIADRIVPGKTDGTYRVLPTDWSSLPVDNLNDVYVNHGWCAFGEYDGSLESSNIGDTTRSLSDSEIQRIAVQQFLNHGFTAPELGNTTDVPFDGYEPSQRWVRTANDAALTQHRERKRYWMSGIVHPNVGSHVYQADRIAACIAKENSTGEVCNP